MVITNKFRIFAPMEAKNNYLSPQDICEGLINNDRKIINKFFTSKEFDTFVDNVFDRIFSHDSEFESAKATLANDLFFYLTDNDSKRLREYNEEEDGDFFIWLKRKVINFYRNAKKTDNRRQALLKKLEEKDKIVGKEGNKERLTPLSPLTPEDELELKEIDERIEEAISILDKDNPIYAEIMRRELLYGNFDARTFATEFNIKYGNMSMNKKRAFLALQNIYKNLIAE